jgi:hypothetical protein
MNLQICKIFDKPNKVVEMESFLCLDHHNRLRAPHHRPLSVSKRVSTYFIDRFQNSGWSQVITILQDF